MQRNNKKVIKNYFSDYITWLIFTTSLMIVSFTAALIFNASNRFIWVIPAVLGIMYMLSLPLLILYIKVRKDMHTRYGNKKEICQEGTQYLVL